MKKPIAKFNSGTLREQLLSYSEQRAIRDTKWKVDRHKRTVQRIETQERIADIKERKRKRKERDKKETRK